MERLDRISSISIVSRGGVRYRRLMKIMIESGGMYCLTWLILLCLVLSGSTAIHVFFSIIGQLTVRYVSNSLDHPRGFADPGLFFFCLIEHRGYTRRSSSCWYR